MFIIEVLNIMLHGWSGQYELIREDRIGKLDFIIACVIIPDIIKNGKNINNIKIWRNMQKAVKFYDAIISRIKYLAWRQVLYFYDNPIGMWDNQSKAHHHRDRPDSLQSGSESC